MRELPLFLLLLAFAPVVSCSKDVRQTNKIHGTWDIVKLEEISSNGTMTFSTNPGGVMQFDKCQILDDDFRAFRRLYSYSANGSDVSVNQTGFYKFTEGGRMLTVRIPDDNGDHDTHYTVTSLRHKSLTMEYQQSDGSKMIYSLEK